MKTRIIEIMRESTRVQQDTLEKHADQVLAAARMLAQCLVSGHKILIFGNGGSAADAQHIAAEFVNRFALERDPLPALALTTDTSVLTAIGNDYGFDLCFEKQVRALGRPGDAAWGISTSGGSRNVIVAMDAARRMGLATLFFTGQKGVAAKDLADIVLASESASTPRIQETHIVMAHILCELVEDTLFPGAGKV